MDLKVLVGIALSVVIGVLTLIGIVSYAREEWLRMSYPMRKLVGCVGTVTLTIWLLASYWLVTE